MKETGTPEKGAGGKVGKSEVWDTDPSFNQESFVNLLSRRHDTGRSTNSRYSHITGNNIHFPSFC